MPGSRRLARIPLADYSLPPEITRRLLSPALVIRLDVVRSNVRQMLEYTGGVADRWRPHLKTTKTPEVWRELVLAGVRNFKCATPREAEVLLALLDAMAVRDADLLVVYPLLPPNLDQVARLAAAHPRVRVSVLSEDPQHAVSVPADLDVFVDINPQMNRTGVPMGDRPAIERVARAAGARFRGLHFYDGHVRDADIDTRRRRTWELYDELLRIEAALCSAGIVVEELITSGTPAFPYALSHPGLAKRTGGEHGVHRVSPGTVVFHDAFSDDLLEDVELRPAAVLFTRVVSHPSPGIVTCDAGSKSLAAEAGDPAAFVLGHPDLTALKPSEEHLPLRCAGAPPPRGTELLLVPKHVCPTVNLAERALLIEPGAAPRVVAVAARAHDVLVDGESAVRE